MRKTMETFHSRKNKTNTTAVYSTTLYFTRLSESSSYAHVSLVVYTDIFVHVHEHINA